MYKEVEGDECRADLWGQKLNDLYTKKMQCYPEGLQGPLQEFEIGKGEALWQQSRVAWGVYSQRADGENSL